MENLVRVGLLAVFLLSSGMASADGLPANDFLQQLQAEKSLTLEVRSGSTAEPFKESETDALLKPTAAFLRQAQSVGVGVSESDSGWLHLRDSAIGYRVEKKAGDGFLIRFAEILSQGSMDSSLHTRIVVEPGEWITLGEFTHTGSNDGAEYFYTVIRIRSGS